MSLPDTSQLNSTCGDKAASEDELLDKAKPRGGGYGKPPVHSQFKGSGNPGGRPKKRPAEDLDTRIINFLETKLPHSEKTGIDLLLNTLMTQSIKKGDVKAIRYLLDRYHDAKHRTRHTGVDEEADRKAAQRLFASLGVVPYESAAEGTATSADAADD